MACILLTGIPGSGKSYSAIQLCVLPALDLGRPVRANIPLMLDEIRQVWPGADVGLIDTTDPDCWDAIPGGALVVLDECGSIWPAGSRADRENPKAVEFLAMHRHRTGAVGAETLSTEVVLLSQGSKDIAAWVKSKVDKTYTIKKMDAVGADRLFRVDVYQGWQDTARPLKRDHVRGYTGRYSPKVFRFYESHTKGPGEASGVTVSELRADKSATIWNSWTMKAAIGAVPLFALVVWVMVGWFQNAYGAPGAAAQLAEPQATARPLSASPSTSTPIPSEVKRPALEPPKRPVLIVVSQSWRLSGWHSVKAGFFSVVLVGEGGKVRKIHNAGCKLIGYQDLECVIDGERVASYTGPVEQQPGMMERAAGVIPGLRPSAAPDLARNVPPGPGPQGGAW